ncbi:hypothetical protein I3842_15G116000 [Carya illinoinensis]|uniref:Calponin-homology (CH) domain-containing protein n=1 Tax=Carya illinoinensis TaxID=32201 RepID=A0A922D7L2_CARIL|nr:hypothetical protein I3842_15G116000 [Carya illinoinensis]
MVDDFNEANVDAVKGADFSPLRLLHLHAFYFILNKLRPGSVSEEGDSSCSSVFAENIKSFLSSMDDLLMPKFEMSDLVKGSMKSVIECLATLIAQFMPNVVVDNFSLTSLITNCGSPHGDASSSGHLSQLSGEERQKLVSNSDFQHGWSNPFMSGIVVALCACVHEVF